MKAFIKSYWKTLLFFGMMGLVGGFFTGLFIMASHQQPKANTPEAI